MIKKKKILVIKDNVELYKGFKEIINDLNIDSFFSFASSEGSRALGDFGDVECIDLKDDNYVNSIIANYNLVISLHARQIFPNKLVKGIRCVNIHPGYNPFNRGWFPHVFSLINGLPMGVTIHEMDEHIDHGPIIAQKQLIPYSWDDSSTIYKRLLKLELKLIKENIVKIIENDYTSKVPETEGNLNYISDFAKLCKLDFNENNSFENFANKLRALTHEDYKNAYFIDKNTNKKVFVKISFSHEE